MSHRSLSSRAALLAFGGLSAGTFGLGVWQTVRYFDKYEMTERRRVELEAAPVDAVEALSTSGGAARRVAARGRFDNSRVALLGPRPPPKDMPPEFAGRDVGGYVVVTPLAVDDEGHEVLVLRGWVPFSRMQDLPAILAQSSALVEIEGVLRGSETVRCRVGALPSPFD